MTLSVPSVSSTSCVSSGSLSSMPKKSKSIDLRCPYCKARAVPPTSLVCANCGKAVTHLRSSNVSGATVPNASICNPPFECLIWCKYMKGKQGRAYGAACKLPQYAAVHNKTAITSSRSNRRTPAHAAQRKQDVPPCLPRNGWYPKTKYWTI